MADAGARAADVFTADLRPRPGGRFRHRARIGGAFGSELLWQRVPAGEPFPAGDLLARVRDELERQDAESFLAGWSEPPGR